MSSIAEILAEIAALVEEPLSSAPFEIAVHAGMVFNPTTTCVDVYPSDPFRDDDYAGMGDIGGAYRFDVRARTGLNDLDTGQTILMALMDDENDYSIGYSLSDDPTLNGTASSSAVIGPSGFRPYRDLGGEGTMVGVVWTILVMAVDS